MSTLVDTWYFPNITVLDSASEREREREREIEKERTEYILNIRVMIMLQDILYVQIQKKIQFTIDIQLIHYPLKGDFNAL